MSCMIHNSAPPAATLRVAGRSRARGFTLIELTVAATLAGLVVVTAATLIAQVTAARHRMALRAEHDAQADAAIHTLTTAIQCAFRNPGDEPPLFDGLQETLDGKPADRLRLFTVSDHPVRLGEPESDVHEVEFYIERKPGQPYADLIRRTDPTRNAPPDEGGVIDRVASNITALQLTYLDGDIWVPQWPAHLGRLPNAVRMRIGVALDPQRNTARPYNRLIHLPLLPEFRRQQPTQPTQGGEHAQ